MPFFLLFQAGRGAAGTSDIDIYIGNDEGKY